MQFDTYDLFRTFCSEDPDFNRADERADLAQLIERETKIEGFLNGQTRLSEVLDCLSDQGIEPDDWVDTTVNNIEFIIDSGIHFASNDKGIYLPLSSF
ncbi:hypothetical protein [Pseudanabaena sp. FACHB-2040]|uniref:hypothetical protein n=1 Tax=Pseudanabaena sp. FACHB-2040 TaxID=2692859 RepID=UPI001686258C|nr:hypothetical protein [Pseudanabaena sp. FACHB-2040]MBD2259912.1 hypothetical protein [Pseudanabaena sp. FACHB-2040]